MISGDTLAYIAGVIDAEGSIEKKLVPAIRNGKRYEYYYPIVRIKTTDDIIVPTIASDLGKTHSSAKYRDRHCHILSLYSNEARELLRAVRRYLLIKRRQVDIVLATGSSFSPDLALLNEGYTPRGYPIDHDFHPAWLAGLVDGDGSIYATQYNKCWKVIIGINLTDIEAVEYLATSVFNKTSQADNDKRPTRRKRRRIRLLANDVIKWYPIIRPHIRLKTRQLDIAYRICVMRRDKGRVNKLSNELIGLIDELRLANKH